METDIQEHGFEYERKVLNRVSRSFALTIPLLPEPLRRTVTNAYLICRIIDTIEDEKDLTMIQKLFFFRKFIQVISGRAPAERFAQALWPLLTGSTLPEERDLIANTPLIIRNNSTFTLKQQAAIRRCASVMVQGMSAIQMNKGPHGLRDLTDLDNYCYHVAGVVGEMLTELFCEYSVEIAKNRKRLLELAVPFGQGLQMTNILKDIWDDKNRGFCWLPRSVFSQAGYDLDELSADRSPELFVAALSVLIDTALARLRDALDYTFLIPRHETGIRKFCLWAIGIAVFTLRKINRKSRFESSREVKISRRTLKTIIMITNASVRSNFLLEKLFCLSAGVFPRNPAPGTARADEGPGAGIHLKPSTG
ncbi:MAG: phytoene/squalene synthase family protein [Syntrophales bacterium]